MTNLNSDVNQNYTFLEKNKEFFYGIVGYVVVFIWNATDLIGGELKSGIDWKFYKISFILGVFALMFQLLAILFFLLDEKYAFKQLLVVYTYIIGSVSAAVSLALLVIHVLKGLKIEDELVNLSFISLIVVLSLSIVLAALKYYKNN